MNEKILLVDDDQNLLEIFEMSLETLGYKILTASDGEAGVEMYKKHKPCMVFSDIKMSKLDGYELFSSIRKLNSNAKVILVTGHEDKEKSKVVIKDGLIDVLIKPVSIKLLNNILKKHTC